VDAITVRSLQGSVAPPPAVRTLQSGMARRITQQDLRDESDDILRALGEGESFIVTRDGLPVGELVPLRPRTFVPVAELKQIFADAPYIDYHQFRRDIDEYLDHDPTPRV
jgi:antitoxin (DNA-binding transcriptional repressor) of toxin-antitoxin stability system